MRLITTDIADISERVITEFCKRHQVPPQRLYDVAHYSAQFTGEALRDYSHALDFGATGWIAMRAKTFLFNSDQIMAFLAAIDRRLPPGDYPAPFQFVCIQFSSGIDEKLFTSGLRSSGNVEAVDEILGLIIAVPDEAPGHQFMNVVAWYKSTSINRVQVSVSGGGEIEYRPLDDTIADKAEQLYRDKQRLANLALLCLAYINSPGIEIEHIEPDAAMNRKRAAKGKRELPDYYICRVSKRRLDGEEDSATGRHVSFRFDVRGHFRRLQDGRTIWIRPHQRGLENEVYVPKAYRVD